MTFPLYGANIIGARVRHYFKHVKSWTHQIANRANSAQIMDMHLHWCATLPKFFKFDACQVLISNQHSQYSVQVRARSVVRGRRHAALSQSDLRQNSWTGTPSQNSCKNSWTGTPWPWWRKGYSQSPLAFRSFQSVPVHGF